MPDDVELRRLSWACRRGMLELDVLLQHFLSHSYAQLGEQERMLFAQLLDQADPVLHRYFNTDERPDDPAMCALIETIRRSMGKDAEQQ